MQDLNHYSVHFWNKLTAFYLKNLENAFLHSLFCLKNMYTHQHMKKLSNLIFYGQLYLYITSCFHDCMWLEIV